MGSHSAARSNASRPRRWTSTLAGEAGARFLAGLNPVNTAPQAPSYRSSQQYCPMPLEGRWLHEQGEQYYSPRELSISPAGHGAPLFGVGHQLGDAVSALHNREVESPVLVDAGLPAVADFVKLLGMQGRIVKVSSQKVKLFDKGLLHCHGSVRQLLDGALRELYGHPVFFNLAGAPLAFHFLRKAATSAPLLNGP